MSMLNVKDDLRVYRVNDNAIKLRNCDANALIRCGTTLCKINSDKYFRDVIFVYSNNDFVSFFSSKTICIGHTIFLVILVA